VSENCLAPANAFDPHASDDGSCQSEAAVSKNEAIAAFIARPTSDRIYYAAEALRAGLSVDEVVAATKIDPFFINRIADIVAVQESIRGLALADLDADALRLVKQYGFSDVQIAHLCAGDVDELEVRARRHELGVLPSFKTVDTCAAEFASATEYHYKTYDAAATEVGECANLAASTAPAGVPSEAAQPLQAMQRGLSQYPERKRSGVATTGALRDGAVYAPTDTQKSLESLSNLLQNCDLRFLLRA
jgi:hypothetical protein